MRAACRSQGCQLVARSGVAGRGRLAEQLVGCLAAARRCRRRSGPARRSAARGSRAGSSAPRRTHRVLAREVRVSRLPSPPADGRLLAVRAPRGDHERELVHRAARMRTRSTSDDAACGAASPPGLGTSDLPRAIELVPVEMRLVTGLIAPAPMMPITGPATTTAPAATATPPPISTAAPAAPAELVAVAPRRHLRTLRRADAHELEPFAQPREPDVVGRDAQPRVAEQRARTPRSPPTAPRAA